MADEWPNDRVKIVVAEQEWHWRGAPGYTLCGRKVKAGDELAPYPQRGRYRECKTCRKTWKKMG